jgi:hypothetical protein
MYEEMWKHLRLMQEFDSESGADADYFARGIWISLQALATCIEFSSVNFASHTMISNVFVRFLAEETGTNFASGMTSTISDIKSSVAGMAEAQAKVNKAMTIRMDNHADNLKKLCVKADLKYIPNKGGKD